MVSICENYEIAQIDFHFTMTNLLDVVHCPLADKVHAP